MKKGILSVCISIIGFFFVFKYHMLMHDIHHSLITGKEIRFIFINDLMSFTKLFKMLTISTALLGLYLGLIALLKKNKIGILGIFLSILLFISVFIPFWKYVAQETSIGMYYFQGIRKYWL